MATDRDEGSMDVGGGVHPAQKKNPIDLNRWLVVAVVVLAIAVITLATLLLTDGDDEVSSIVASPETTVASPEPASAEFPTGTFEATSGSSGVEFNEDGTCRHYALSGGWSVPCTYAINNDLFTEMTFEAPTGVQAPATYYWAFDGEFLTFELWGEDVRPFRQQVYADQVFAKAE